MNDKAGEMPSSQFTAGYQAAHRGAGLRDENGHGRLWLSGPDRVPFLQRLTTNDVRLEAGQGTATVLTTPTARIVAVFAVLAQEQGLLLLAGGGQGPAAYTALRSQIFFGDRVEIEGRGTALAQFGLYGPEATTLLASIAPGAVSTLPPFHWQELTLNGVRVTVQGNEGLGSEGYTLLAAGESAEALRQALVTAGAVPLSEEAFHAVRVEAGVPEPGLELTDRVNPLEAGLRRYCSDHKGCYTGQEIIARQITYDKIANRLVGLLPDGRVARGAPVKADGKTIGFVTSATYSPSLGRPLALGFVRRPHDNPDTTVTIAQEAGAVGARVAALPFLKKP